jgi:dephospho-CoA kinase
LTSRPYVIGLTGNIATGKSTVGRMLAQRGAEHIDADRLAHQVMAQGTDAWEQIVRAFGREILRPDGEIDRARLGAIVFSDDRALARLERIVHPPVIARTRVLIERSNAPVVVVEAIKLIESGMVAQLCDALWVVTAPRDVQIERLVVERGLSQEDAVARVDVQPPQSDKAAHADVVIDNGGSIEATRRQVGRAWEALEMPDPAPRASSRDEGPWT